MSLYLFAMICLLAFGVTRTSAQAAGDDGAAGIHANSNSPYQMTEADVRLLDEIEERAFRFFWERADAHTGLVSDRASNSDKDEYTVATIAATGYALAALPPAVERGWITRQEAEQRAHLTLDFVLHKMPHKHGWLYHFVDKRTGARAWKCEVSSIDTGLLLAGAQVCGEYFRQHHASHNVARLAQQLVERVNWTWMRTRNGKQPQSLLLAHGWKPERGFLPYNWDTYSEGMLLYLLGLGAEHDPLPPASWHAWTRTTVSFPDVPTSAPSSEGDERPTPKDWTVLTGGPLFLNQMPFGFFDLRNRRDSLGYDYVASAHNAPYMQRDFCLSEQAKSVTYAQGFWGLSASDGPKGYEAYGAPRPHDGTVSPAAILASLPFAPRLCLETAHRMRDFRNGRLWGRYGFVDAFNLDARKALKRKTPADDAEWFDGDVIGIDLGMALVAIENQRTGLIWKLNSTLPSTQRALKLAGFHVTQEAEPRALHIPNSR